MAKKRARVEEDEETDEDEEDDDGDDLDMLAVLADLLADQRMLLFAMVATLACPVCAGLGRIPSPEPSVLRPCECREKARRTLEKVAESMVEDL